MDLRDDDYYAYRAQNILQKNEFLRSLGIKADAKDFANSVAAAVAKDKVPVSAKRRRHEINSKDDPDFDPSQEDEQDDDDDYKSIRLARKLSKQLSYRPITTRSKSNNEFKEMKLLEVGLSDTEKVLIVKFPFCKRQTEENNSAEDDDNIVLYDSEPEGEPTEGEEGTMCPPPLERRRASNYNVNRDRVILAPEEITEKDLAAVCHNFGAKVYSQSHGTTCHQCRQKTVDMKTICRDPQCHGVRGAFCGRCLLIRYGEDIKAVLKDPEWRCPACRGICNCSICRRRAGLNCTGVLIHTAQEEGFESVKDYLACKKKRAI